jgi:hypothetical protein
VELTNIYLKIFFNDKEVTQTAKFNISPIAFEVKFVDMDFPVDSETRDNPSTGLTIQMTVTEIPETIRIDLYEIGPAGDQIISEIFVPIPDCTETAHATDDQFKNIDFSGLPFSLNSIKNESDTNGRWYTGALSLNCYWGVNKDGSSLGPKRKYIMYKLIVRLAQESRAPHTLDPLVRNGPAGILNLSCLLVSL